MERVTAKKVRRGLLCSLILVVCAIALPWQSATQTTKQNVSQTPSARSSFRPTRARLALQSDSRDATGRGHADSLLHLHSDGRWRVERRNRVAGGDARDRRRGHHARARQRSTLTLKKAATTAEQYDSHGVSSSTSSRYVRSSRNI